MRSHQEIKQELLARKAAYDRRRAALVRRSMAIGSAALCLTAVLWLCLDTPQKPTVSDTPMGESQRESEPPKEIDLESAEEPSEEIATQWAENTTAGTARTTAGTHAQADVSPKIQHDVDCSKTSTHPSLQEDGNYGDENGAPNVAAILLAVIGGIGFITAIVLCLKTK